MNGSFDIGLPCQWKGCRRADRAAISTAADLFYLDAGEDHSRAVSSGFIVQPGACPPNRRLGNEIAVDAGVGPNE